MPPVDDGVGAADAAVGAHGQPRDELLVRLLHLTDIGREVAEQIYEKHRFFTERLIAAGVDPETAERDACRIEHVISDESFQCLKEAMSQE